jgi:hypothetical protein
MRFAYQFSGAFRPPGRTEISINNASNLIFVIASCRRYGCLVAGAAFGSRLNCSNDLL